jgi:hypothetical protein
MQFQEFIFNASFHVPPNSSQITLPYVIQRQGHHQLTQIRDVQPVASNKVQGVCVTVGRAITQAVSRRLPTAAARVQTRAWSCGIL